MSYQIALEIITFLSEKVTTTRQHKYNINVALKEKREPKDWINAVRFVNTQKLEFKEM